MSDKRKTKKRKDEHADSEADKPSKQEYFVAKWLKANVPTKKTKFHNHPVEYFTGSKAVDALMESKWATGKNPLFTTRPECIQFCHQMLLHKFYHRGKKVPVSEQELKGKKKKELKDSKSGDEKEAEKSQASACEGNDKDQKQKDKNKKRKIRLEMHLEQVFLDTKDAYIWIFDPMPWWYWVCGALVVFATIAICMFPLWPPIVRKGVYHLSIAAAAFLVLIIALAILRVVLFWTIWVLTLTRHHLWLLPNLTEDVGFFASFWPLYKYEYCPPNSESDKNGKTKKKRKKDKHSDEEVDEKTPLVEPTNRTQEAGETDIKQPEDDVEQCERPEKESESESETSQRSSTDRDFEMVDRAELEDDSDKK